MTAELEKLHGGMRWAEGPVYFADQHALVFSDIPNERILRYDEVSGAVTLFRGTSNNANGNTRDREGRLITCEQGVGRVTRTEPDGSITVLADSFRGGRLNAPNDVVVKSDGTIWFTDPSYGIATHFVGTPREKEQEVDGVYRLDPVTGALDRIAEDFWKPNGLAFSPDESKLYIVDSGYLPDPAGPRYVRVFDVDTNNAISGGDVLTEVKPGIPDGLRVDDAGRLWIGAGDGVHCVHPDGTLLGKVRVPEAAANLAFGGPKRNRLYIAATTSLYAIFLNTIGIQRP
ncbi:SMP-30/gluconolactonase/LRE family protein [Naasia lichenicola]|uniref:SMP-30/gluconolactonase/LRE family protein n=1 Tax=Naasia lichenicola TaxID=2565933 RepID=A0A4S4FQ94_9MICO|nr:SMP-30/gluconolactonase/LRE family protein [Naasia lichenicola]THG31546.1 SMP-30/gluconolactonase/LRE family protein [Naasia lichenicola]